MDLEKNRDKSQKKTNDSKIKQKMFQITDSLPNKLEVFSLQGRDAVESHHGKCRI